MTRRTRWIVLLTAIGALIVGPMIVVEQQQYSIPAGHPAVAEGRDSFAVYVADFGYHTSIIVQQPAGWQLGPRNAPVAPYVEFAWGNRDYFMSNAPSLFTGARAALWPSAAVTYVAGWDQAPRVGDHGITQLAVRRLSPTELLALSVELAGTFDRGAEYPPVTGYPGRFYPSAGRYLWWYDCNRWVVERLGAVGMASGGRGVVAAGQVFGRLRAFRNLTAMP